MSYRFKKLTLPDLILNRRGTLTFRLILAAFGIALRLFFRRIETVNADVVPRGDGVIFVLNHPNGLIDPALVFVALPRKISFLAKSTLFRMPVISFLLRTVEALPLYRKIDAGEDVSKNQKNIRDVSRASRTRRVDRAFSGRCVAQLAKTFADENRCRRGSLWAPRPVKARSK
jgi:1-acyl-sn-glycerol-3-phosphate acyltransferase